MLNCMSKSCVSSVAIVNQGGYTKKELESVKRKGGGKVWYQKKKTKRVVVVVGLLIGFFFFFV